MARATPRRSIVLKAEPENVRTGLAPHVLAKAIFDNLHFAQGRVPDLATPHDWYMALAYTVRDRILLRWVRSVQAANAANAKLVCYLSAEFLVGPHLGNNLLNLGIDAPMAEAVKALGLDFDELLALEEEPGLGNGGLGRLAACFMDSLATLGVPAVGYGIRYEFGIFDQTIRDGWQVEGTDKWLSRGNPWEIARPERTFEVKFGGQTLATRDDSGRLVVEWRPAQVVRGVAHDTPITGYRANTVNLLRLFKAEACESFDFKAFNVGDYYGAVDQKIASETISKVLYPNDEPLQGKRLRLAQQYFFVSCALQDMVRIHLSRGNPLSTFHEKFAVQLNDTHPSVGVAELMRLLVDEHAMEWDRAWAVTQKTFAYTNHTLLPEALEKWPVGLFAEMLPRHLEIIYEINRRFLDEVRAKRPGDEQLARRLSLVDESGPRYIRMAHLASVGSHAINGVAALHSELLKKDVMSDFHALWPEKFLNVTNGVTPRRWVAMSNPGLSALLTESLGDGWARDIQESLPRLEPLARDGAFLERWASVKHANKVRLAGIIRSRTGVVVDPASMFDVQVKRIHEYKRQHLNVLHVISLYLRLKHDPGMDAARRTVVFAGKAAPGYAMAKLIIKLINAVAEVVNADREVGERLKVVFVPDFNVTNAQPIYPAADLSEQISTAGKEASGTGNMKFALNGALTIGTLDGANVEIREAVGAENFFLFGLDAAEVTRTLARGYRPWEHCNGGTELAQAIDAIRDGLFSRGDKSLFAPLVDSLLRHDPYLVLADFDSYAKAQREVDRAFAQARDWSRRSVLNTARSGRFSSDRSIRDYCRQIWHTSELKVEL